MKTTTLVSLSKTTTFQKQMYPMSLFYHLPIINTQNMLFQTAWENRGFGDPSFSGE